MFVGFFGVNAPPNVNSQAIDKTTCENYVNLHICINGNSITYDSNLFLEKKFKHKKKLQFSVTGGYKAGYKLIFFGKEWTIFRASFFPGGRPIK